MVAFGHTHRFVKIPTSYTFEKEGKYEKCYCGTVREKINPIAATDSSFGHWVYHTKSASIDGTHN